LTEFVKRVALLRNEHLFEKEGARYPHSGVRALPTLESDRVSVLSYGTFGKCGVTGVFAVRRFCFLSGMGGILLLARTRGPDIN